MNKKIVFVLALALMMITAGFVVVTNDANAQDLGIDPFYDGEAGFYRSSVDSANDLMGGFEPFSSVASEDGEIGCKELGAFSIGFFYQPTIIRTGHGWHTHIIGIEFNFLEYGTAAIAYKHWDKFYLHIGFLWHFYRIKFFLMAFGGQFYLALGDDRYYGHYYDEYHHTEVAVDFGLRFDLDLEFSFLPIPMTFYIALNPIFEFVTNTHAGFEFELGITLGMRYYFDI